MALVSAALVFSESAAERLVARAFLISGVLALVGTVGPLAGDMRLQRIGILGYAVVLPVAFFILARFFSAQDLDRSAPAPHPRLPGTNRGHDFE
jgi:hypothetical protein